jgi:hypothetical protein
MNTFPVSDETVTKYVDIINCTFSGTKVGFSAESIGGSYFQIQPVSGTVEKVTQSGTTTISAFAPSVYNDGDGLLGEYYNGASFDNFAFSRIDSIIMFTQWTKDVNASPTGVHHLITNQDAFSVRWTGYIMPQFTQSHTFMVSSKGGCKLWVNGTLIIDSWTESDTDRISSPISLTTGQTYTITLEHFNNGGYRGCQLHWNCTGLGRYVNVPQNQLYSTLS